MRIFCVKTERCVTVTLSSPQSSSFSPHSLPRGSYHDEFVSFLVHFSYFYYRYFFLCFLKLCEFCQLYYHLTVWYVQTPFTPFNWCLITHHVHVFNKWIKYFCMVSIEYLVPYFYLVLSCLVLSYLSLLWINWLFFVPLLVQTFRKHTF